MEPEEKKHETVIVTFNGEDRHFEYRPDEKVQELLNRALDEFGIKDNRHTMSLFSASGAELADDATLKEANVKPGEVLLLRQSQVKGG